jgi:beta-glucanase (GH16 family)
MVNGIHPRFAIPAILAGLIAALLVANPAAEAAGKQGKRAAVCAKAKRTKKAKGKTGKACRQTRPPVPAPATPAPPPKNPSAAPQPDACGARIPKGGGGYWECTFTDEFGGPGLDPNKWIAQRTDTSGYLNGPTACFVDDPDNISVSGGTLKLTARKEQEPFTCRYSETGEFETSYTSGMVSTWGRFGQAFGRFEVRARISDTQVKGLQTAFWLWPVDANRYGPWPASGEIDIAEMFSQYPDRAIPYLHYHAEPSANVTNNYCFVSDLDEFHTYAVEWTSSGIRVMYDGQTCLETLWNPASPLKSPQPFDQPFLIALTQALGAGTNEFDPATTPLPATTEVDFVRVWK